MSVLSISFAATEGEEGDAVLETYSQIFAQLAASGISVMVGSGDSGSNPTPTKGAGFYSTSEPLAVTYPASDPSVTGIGGTAINFDGDWNYAGEIVWNDIGDLSAGSLFEAGVADRRRPARGPDDALRGGCGGLCLAGRPRTSSRPGLSPTAANGVGLCRNGEPKYASGTSLSCPVWSAGGDISPRGDGLWRVLAGPIGLLAFLYPWWAPASNDVIGKTTGPIHGPGL